MDNLFYVIFHVIMIILCVQVGTRKSRAWLGFFMGFFFDLFGLIVMLLVKNVYSPDTELKQADNPSSIKKEKEIKHGTYEIRYNPTRHRLSMITIFILGILGSYYVVLNIINSSNQSIADLLFSLMLINPSMCSSLQEYVESMFFMAIGMTLTFGPIWFSIWLMNLGKRGRHLGETYHCSTCGRRILKYHANQEYRCKSCHTILSWFN